MSLLLVLVGGAVGAPARFLIDRAVMRGRGGSMPWGTFVVNVIGSFMLGVVVSATSMSPPQAVHTVVGLSPEQWRLLLGTGFCGALSTYSTFSFENVRLLEEGRVGLALANTGGTIITTCAAVAAAQALGAAPGPLLGLVAGA